MKLFLFILFLVCAATASVVTKKLTIGGAFTGAFLALAIYAGAGWAGIILLGSFFILGTAATSVGKRYKERLGIAQDNGGRRNTGQVLANGGVAGILGAIAFLFPQYGNLCLLMIAASFSSATADTLSSELGSIYGSRFYDVLSFKKGRRGDDGIISLEGLLFGLEGSLLIAVIYACAAGWGSNVVWIIVAGTVGNLTDSVLGATLERKGVLRNDAVNFLATVAAALFILLVTVLQS